MNKKTIFIIVGVAVVAIAAFYFIKKNKKNNSTATTESILDIIPARVLAEPVADWEGDVFSYEGKRYTPVNGVWTQINK